MTHTVEDPTLLAILANRLEAIGREMTNTMLRTARSAVIGTARDFSCSIVTGDDRLLASSAGLPVHIFGSHLQSAAMRELHPDLRDGDAYLHNDPYLGNTHHADHTILVPVFVDGEHLFTAVAKAHQADIGNSQPTTYMPFARDVYEEGAISFPCVRIQRDRTDIAEIIRMARRRIRVPGVWYGDYLAALGAARIGERRLQELVERYGADTIRQFVESWFDYSERRMREGLRAIPSGRYVGRATHDPVPGVEEGVPVTVIADVDAEHGHVVIDLRDNPDCVPAGLNQSEATATNSVVTGLFNVLDSDIPHNAGSFRCIEVLLRENCVVGIPLHPTSCSMATTNVADRLVNATQAAFADVGGRGLAHGGAAMGAEFGVISGTDPRRGDGPYVNQIVLGNNGGGAAADTDGWLTLALPVTGGVLNRDSVEVIEEKYPVLVESLRLITDGGGAGRRRGAPPAEVVYGPRESPMFVAFAGDGAHNPAKGVCGARDGLAATAQVLGRTAEPIDIPTIGVEQLVPGERLRANAAGGGGYGDPLDREPELVRTDVLEGWVSSTAAHDVYGVVLTGGIDDETLAVDRPATTELRRRRRPS
ncbi:hydantoinase B/oxoprolinase family protein [Pseudonocardia sp. C8]|uniref:hydantoinase B/oxoprolinase family protein n=1 Tax=Pseudonocardia sp. C8 TaxID=2762759 RepID=UPI0016435F30|nr:hydantoinase B/oxoprolinase family protein [Pseudonocardia sp. C8]MBC3191001.1 hydantoinase B/oxoprolinase family protein [Pseudonocardia sp. C8]